MRSHVTKMPFLAIWGAAGYLGLFGVRGTGGPVRCFGANRTLLVATNACCRHPGRCPVGRASPARGMASSRPYAATVPPCSAPSSASAPPHAAALRVTALARGGPWAASGRAGAQRDITLARIGWSADSKPSGVIGGATAVTVQCYRVNIEYQPRFIVIFVLLPDGLLERTCPYASYMVVMFPLSMLTVFDVYPFRLSPYNWDIISPFSS